MVTAITNELLRSCIQLDVGSAERLDERKRVMPLKRVTHLVFSFKDLRTINHLDGLDYLERLHLDNNSICKIENLSHLANLTILDLSFNKIEKIEGLESLRNLDDLSLYCNQIKHLEGLETLQKLTSLSVGKNLLQSLDEILYLRRLKNLQLLTMDGNPLCREQDYRTYVIGHLRDLRFLDHRVVDEASQGSNTKMKCLRSNKKRQMKMWLVRQLKPGLLSKSFSGYRQKNDSNNEEVTGLILEQHGKKKEEIAAWKQAVKLLLDERDRDSLSALDSFNKLKKKVFLESQQDPATAESKLQMLLEANKKLKEKLLEFEMLSVGEIQDLWSKFDDNYAVLVENCRQHYQNQYPFKSLCDAVVLTFNSTS